MKRFSLIVLVSGIILLLWPSDIFGQLLRGGKGGSKDRIEGDIKFLPLPYVNYNRSFGYQIGALPMVMFNPVRSDTASPSSIAGAAAIYSKNKTWFVMGFAKLHLDADNWRVAAAGGSGSVNFQFFLENPVNSWIPYNTKLDLLFGQVERRIIHHIYGGTSLIYMKLKTTTEMLPVEENTTLKGLGLQITADRRSSVHYPRSGFFTHLKYFTYPKFFGNKDVSSKIEIDFNQYIPARQNHDVLAGRFFAGIGLGDLTFNQKLIVGRTDIRGYTQGEVRGNYLLDIQGEYRWNILDRFGIVGFLGLATVFKAINEKDDGRLLPGIGAGFRYTVDTETHMNAGMDLAFGIGDWGIYFRIGEAF